MTFLYFIVLVGVLVFIHELGHFAWARLFGVKVLRVSLGFGPKLVGFRRRETEYVIAAIPLGGYVRMLGESPQDVVRPDEEARSFQGQPIWKRVVIAAAGPAMNLVLPLLLYFVIFLGDTHMAPPVVGTVFPDRPADGRVHPGDRIAAVNGAPVRTFYEVRRRIEASAERELVLDLIRDGEPVQVTVRPERSISTRPLDLTDEIGRIGITPHRPLAVVGVASPLGPAGAARLRTMDLIVSVAGEPVDDWIELEELLGRSRGAAQPVTYLRPTRLEGALGGLVELDLYEPHVSTLVPDVRGTDFVTKTGLEPADLYVSHVALGSPEHQMGLLPGDRILALDGRPVRLWATFLEDLRAGEGREHTLTWRRGTRTRTAAYRLERERGVNEHGQPYDRYVVGIRNWMPVRIEAGVPNPSPVRYAIAEAVHQTLEMMELTVFSVVRLVQGRLTVRSLGGPLTIFEVAGTAAREGAASYFILMAFISINLGLINLLPIPLLDGGHLVFFVLEAVTRRRPSRAVRRAASLAGLVILVTLMVLAFKNDLERQWPHIADRLAIEP